MIVHGLIFLSLVSIVPSNSVTCYECGCSNINIYACDCGETTTSHDGDFRIINEQRLKDKTNIQLSRLRRNTTLIYIEDHYFILLKESILFNQTTMDWYLWTDNAVLCHHCPSETCGDSENPIDFTLCPITTCDNVTTCLAYDLWIDFDTGEQCYQSQCAPEYLDEDLDEFYNSKYRIDIEVVVYLAQDRSKYYIWEMDVYCGAYNCTRPTMFQEIADALNYTIGDLSFFPLVRPTTIQPLPTTTAIKNPLKYYSCECTSSTTCACTSFEVVSLDDTYCIIAREHRDQDISFNFTYLDYYASYNYILEAPFVVVEETISYDERTARWLTATNLVLYGCNWNSCNKSELISLLPNTFQMRLPETWLNTSILGTGRLVRDCHECPDAPQCGTTDFLDSSRCPIHSCNTTCRVSDTFNDPAFELLCYQSFCISSSDDQNDINHHRVEIEGLTYASEPNDVKIWEIDLYCRADNCSNPEVFKELREQINIQIGTLAALFNETHDPTIPQRRCYDCDCFNEINCNCTRTTIKSANTTYCLILHKDYDEDRWITLGHLGLDSSRVHIRDLPYLLLEESISYNATTGRWN
ncbi:unnamed protein product [Rotaria sp. Silwood2]|nr:unnamed protein product [Rotaria sp. Silwood2]